MDIPQEESQIIEGLRCGAAGYTRTVAAVELLIETHQHTLSRVLGAPLVRQTLYVGDGSALLVGWRALRRTAHRALRGERELPARSAQVCMIACELAWSGECTGWALTDLLSGLDQVHTHLVVRAIQRHQGVSVPPYQP